MEESINGGSGRFWFEDPCAVNGGLIVGQPRTYSWSAVDAWPVTVDQEMIHGGCWQPFFYLLQIVHHGFAVCWLYEILTLQVQSSPCGPAVFPLLLVIGYWKIM